MSKNTNDPTVKFPDWYDARIEFETPAKGWLSDVIVQTNGGQRYTVSFIDPVRLQQDMKEYVNQGTPYFSEPGLIILDEVTTEAVEIAVRELWKQDFFSHLQPISSDDQTAVDQAENVMSDLG